MNFKGVELEIGDHIAFETSEVPLPHVEAAVMGVKDGILDVFSTLLVPFQHSGFFSEDSVGEIEIVRKAKEAIPSTSPFEKDQEVTCEVKGTTRRGFVIAAFDGIVVMKSGDDFVTAGADLFSGNRMSEEITGDAESEDVGAVGIVLDGIQKMRERKRARARLFRNLVRVAGAIAVVLAVRKLTSRVEQDEQE